jgi:hypothetical protein
MSSIAMNAASTSRQASPISIRSHGSAPEAQNTKGNTMGNTKGNTMGDIKGDTGQAPDARASGTAVLLPTLGVGGVIG